MRKIIIPMMLILAMTSCSRQDSDEYVTVRFGLKGDPFTKSYVEDVRAIIAPTLPSVINLSLVSARTSYTYSVATGASIVLPVGRYAVSGVKKPAVTTEVYGTDIYFGNAPLVRVSEDVNIVSETTAYSISPQYSSIALVIDNNEIASWKFQNSNAAWLPVPNVLTAGDYSVAFLTWSGSSRAVSVSVSPVDVNLFETREFVLDPTQLQSGYFYQLHPNGVTTEEGAFGLNYSTWQEGEI